MKTIQKFVLLPAAALLLSGTFVVPATAQMTPGASGGKKMMTKKMSGKKMMTKKMSGKKMSGMKGGSATGAGSGTAGTTGTAGTGGMGQKGTGTGTTP